MARGSEDNDVYVIPPNFFQPGTFFGGMLKARNAIEAGALAVILGWPIMHLGISFTARICILCFLVLPAALLALIGVSGESLSSFIINFFIYFSRRRVVPRADCMDTVNENDSAAWPKRRLALLDKAVGLFTLLPQRKKNELPDQQLRIKKKMK